MDKVKMSKTCKFEGIPQEIYYLVLSYLDTPTDFYNLIRASPLHFRTYCCDKERYLHVILSQCYDPVNLILALRILAAGRPLPSLTEESLVKFQIPDGADRADWISNHLNCHEYETRLSPCDDPLSVIGACEERIVPDQENGAHITESTKLICLRRLCRLWRLIDYFIHDYSRQAFKQLKCIRSRPTNIPSYDPISTSFEIYRYGVSEEHRHGLRRYEYDRMQRAFLYFELYRRLFGGLQPYISPEADVVVEEEEEGGGGGGGDRVLNAEQNKFGRMLTREENAELGSIHEYFVIHMAEVNQYVKRYVISRQAVISNHKKALLTEYHMNRQLSRVLEDASTSCSETAVFLVELGLPFCRRFFSMPVPQQAAVIHRYRTSTRHPRLVHTIAYFLSRYGYPGRNKYIFDNRLHNFRMRNTLMGCIKGVKHEAKNGRDGYAEGENYKRNRQIHHYRLRRAGLFFWDDKRLYDLCSRGWLRYIGCYLRKEAFRAWWKARAGQLNLDENLSDDGMPWALLPPGEDETPEEVDGQDSDGDDDDDDDDDDFARAKRASQEPDVKYMPTERLVEAEIDLEIDGFDY